MGEVDLCGWVTTVWHQVDASKASKAMSEGAGWLVCLLVLLRVIVYDIGAYSGAAVGAAVSAVQKSLFYLYFFYFLELKNKKEGG